MARSTIVFIHGLWIHSSSWQPRMDSAPARPHFQAAVASFAGQETKADLSNPTRGPLLITGGEKDHIAPPVPGMASLKKYLSLVISDFKLFGGRGLSLIVDQGLMEVADYSFNWLQKNGL